MSGDRGPLVHVVRVPGLLPFEAGLDWQRRLARARIDGRLSTDLLLLVEHEPVLTLGRGATGSESGPQDLAAGGIPRFEIERGGDVTYHGPGQLVGYPILDLEGFRKDLHWYVRTLEEALILSLGMLSVHGFRVADHTGVWVGDGRGLDTLGREKASGGDRDAGYGDARGSAAGGGAEETGDFVRRRIAAGSLRKIASIGVHVSRWVTWHGFALNVSEAALGPFSAIIPCGIRGVSMTSLETEGPAAPWEEIVSAVESGFGKAFQTRTVRWSPGELERLDLALERGPPTRRPEPALPDRG
jgi:lipoyl(octanoyl) transferase